jgi:hypothetical protein
MNRLECKIHEGFETNCFGDLIAMNACIDQDHWNIFHLSFDEKNGEEEIKYDLDACEGI